LVDVSLFYFGQNEYWEIEINEDGSLSKPFGVGFFDVASNWKLELMRVKHQKSN
jgi:hypothetical protein